jgi:hypothetical protein
MGRQRLGVGDERRAGVFPGLIDFPQCGVQEAAAERVFLPAQAAAEGEKSVLIPSAGLEGEAEQVFAFFIKRGEGKAPLEGLDIPNGAVEILDGEILDG